MDKNLKQFIERVRGINLEKDEKSYMRSILESHMFSNPVRDEVLLRHKRHAMPNGRQDWLKQSLINKLASIKIFGLSIPTKPMPIFLVLALMIGGGFSAAAQNSLPNDPLYPIKIDVNEKVEGWLAISSEAKAQWQATLMERRLQEAEKLAAKGELDADTRAKIEVNFEEHAEKVQDHIAEIKNQDEVEAGADLSSRLESSLKTHKLILNRLAVKGGNDDQIRPLILKIDAKAKKSTEDRSNLELKLSAPNINAHTENETEIEAQADVKSAAEDKMNAAQNKIDEVRKFILDVKDSVDAQATVEAEARLKLADETVAEGKAKLEAKTYGEAFALFQKANRIAQEAKLLLQARKDLNINVESNTETETHVNSDNTRQNNIHSDEKVKIDLGI